MSPALHPLSNLAFLLLQLVAYWEKTFKIDLFKPQIGVVNVTDVSIPIKSWSGGQPPCWLLYILNYEIIQESTAASRILGSFPNSRSLLVHPEPGFKPVPIF